MLTYFSAENGCAKCAYNSDFMTTGVICIDMNNFGLMLYLADNEHSES